MLVDATLAALVNGFKVELSHMSPDNGTRNYVSRAFSPFTTVDACELETTNGGDTEFAAFRVSILSHEGEDEHHYFARLGDDAEAERDEWIETLAAVVRQVTMSLFPPHAIAVNPIPGVTVTATRIMAGYLLKAESSSSVSLLYCELRAFTAGNAYLVMYRDHWCQHEVAALGLTEELQVFTWKGCDCSIFAVGKGGECRFCARSEGERQLWIRAVSNIKVKLAARAPDPTRLELHHFRAAVQERVYELPVTSLMHGVDQNGEPFLLPIKRLPAPLPQGDAEDAPEISLTETDRAAAV